MKLAIRRHGIVIRTVTVTGEKASIGNSDTADVKIEDPYLGAHIADLVRRDGTWHLVDAGTSLEGVSREGTRVEEEELVSGAVYNVGAFEFVPEIEGASSRSTSPGVRPPTAPGTIGAVPETVMEADLGAIRNAAGLRGASPPSVPETVMEADLGAIRRQAGLDAPAAVPHTVMEADIRDIRAEAARMRPAAAQRNAAAALPQQPAPVVPAQQQRSSSGKRLFVILGIFAVGVVLLLVVVVLTTGGEKKKAVAPPVAAKPAPAPAAPPVAVAPPATSRDVLAESMKIDEALTSWEKTVESTNDVRQRSIYAETALDLALVHSANNDSAAARKYFEKVVKFGHPDSQAVAIARERLQTTN